MELHEQECDGAVMLAVAGRVDSATAPELARRLDAAAGAPASRVVLDLEHLEYISSAGFRVILMAAKHAGAAGGRMVVCGLTERMHRLFEVAGFLDVLAHAPTRDEALARLR